MTKNEAKQELSELHFKGFSKQDVFRLVDKIYEDFKLELEAEYKRGWKDRAAQSDLENRTCNNCRSKHCDIKIALIKSDSMNPDYFNCNDWEQK